MKVPHSWVAVFISFAFCLVTPSAGTAYPALTEADTTLNAYINGQTVFFSLYDPSRGAWCIDFRTVDTPANLIRKDGVVAWTGKYGSGYKVWFTVYDAGPGRWVTMSTHQVYNAISSLTVADGVVAWVAQGSDLSNSVNFMIYDPAQGGWRMGVENIPVSSPDHLENKQGIVVFGYVSVGVANVTYFIYDWGKSGWMKGNAYQYGATVSSVSVTDFKAQALLVGLFGKWYSWGYDPASGTWIEGAETKPRAYFVPQPLFGRKPLLVWFTDMSIGANNWLYTFLDTYNYSLGRSSFRLYTKVGLYGVQYGVSGPGGADSATKTVRVGSGVPFLPLLLLD